MALTQDEMVLEFLRRNGEITSLEAFKKLGITRLAACIHRLKKCGEPIISSMEQNPRHPGQSGAYAVYRLAA